MSGDATTLEDFMTREELDAFSRKLEAFTEALTAKERDVLLQVLVRASADEIDDVEGHDFRRLTLGAAALALWARWAAHAASNSI